MAEAWDLDNDVDFGIAPDHAARLQQDDWDFGVLDNGPEDWWQLGEGPNPHLDDFAFPPAPSPSPPRNLHLNHAQWQSAERERPRSPPRGLTPLRHGSTTTSQANPTTRHPLPAPVHPPTGTTFSLHDSRVSAGYNNNNNNWPDPDELRRPAREPYLPAHIPQSEPDTPTLQAESSDYGDIDDLFASDIEAMAPTLRNRPPRDNIVDLTDDASPPQPTMTRSRKRSADTTASHDRSSKRIRKTSALDPNVEELDLTNEAPSAEEELLQSQREAAIAAQQAALESSKPLKIGQRQCIICMEPYTNATVTSCGHIYCHECLTQALIAGEKASERGLGNCPVCRKQVKRTAKGAMIPLSFMKRSAFKGKGKMM